MKVLAGPCSQKPFFLLLFVVGSLLGTQVGLELIVYPRLALKIAVLQPQPPKYWYCMQVHNTYMQGHNIWLRMPCSWGVSLALLAPSGCLNLQYLALVSALVVTLPYPLSLFLQPLSHKDTLARLGMAVRHTILSGKRFTDQWVRREMCLPGQDREHLGGGVGR